MEVNHAVLVLPIVLETAFHQSYSLVLLSSIVILCGFTENIISVFLCKRYTKLVPQN